MEKIYTPILAVSGGDRFSSVLSCANRVAENKTIKIAGNIFKVVFFRLFKCFEL